MKWFSVIVIVNMHTHWLTCPRLVVISKVPSSDLASGTVSLPSGLTMQRLTSRPPWSHTNLVGNVRRDMVTCHE